MRVALLIALAGCGRISFDPLATGDDEPRDSGASDGTIDGITPMVDAPITACSEAIDVGVGRTATFDTCALIDRIDGCGPVGTREIVFRFTASTSGGYNFRAFDGATNNTTNSTGLLDGACAATTTCAGLLGMQAMAGQPMYFVVEASAGGCTSIQFSVQ